MKRMTEGNLKDAFAGESQAHMRYIAFAAKAREEGLPNVARLFEAISYAEQVHATGHLKTLGQVGSTVDNLGAAVAGESFEVESMYPAYDDVAKLEDEKLARVSIRYALEAEKIHFGLYGNAKSTVAGGQDIAMGALQICGTCGYTVEGEAPDKCPICGSPKTSFRQF
jgi:rubrerythrin